jgi:endo-1,4-beta-xylanase
MNRREAISNGLRFAACTAIATAVPSLVGESFSSAPVMLKRARTCGEALIGVAADKASLQNPSVVRFVVQNFNLLTASGMKWNDIQPQPNTYSFAEADWNIHFAEQNGLRVRGHNLCWNSPAAYPAWFKTGLNRANAKRFLTDHITTVMRRYEGRIDQWDVVNEPVVPWSNREDGLYPGIWLNLLGPEYLDIAFDTAESADPKALRVLNIHEVEQGTRDHQLNRERALALVKDLIGRGVPVQAVGIESHLDDSQPLGGAAFQKFISELRALKLQVVITELDVKESRVGNSLNWDQNVAKYYENYLAEVIPVAGPRSVTFWSVKDRWENSRRIQGLMQNNMSPRLTYSASAKALATAPKPCAKVENKNQS